MENLKFRRQYLVTNTDVDKPSTWKQAVIPFSAQKLKVLYHPDLEITIVRNKTRSLLLIGYILDPVHPLLSNKEISNKLLECGDFLQLLQETESLSGRFAILFSDGKNSRMFHDATGFREIYYCFKGGNTYCGSTPDIIKKYANLENDNSAAIHDFLNSEQFRNLGFWVGDDTPVKSVFHLMPNFYLDIAGGKDHRFWPTERREEMPLDKAAEKMSQILKGTIEGAAKRYKLIQALTCGWDSRALLAASRDIKDQVSYRVNKVDNLTDKSADITIPGIIAEKHGLRFEVIDINSVEIDNDFKEIYFGNNVLARDMHLKVFYDAYNRDPENAYWITGTFGNEILRLAFPLRTKKVSAYNIARFYNYETFPFIVEKIESWLKEAREAYRKMDYNLTNIFLWEQFTGNLENLSASEQDITREEIRPFNCREFIYAYLSLKDKHRYKDYPMGHYKIIERLWSELLEVPVAAYTDMKSYHFKRIFRFLGLEIFMDRLYNSIKNFLFYR